MFKLFILVLLLNFYWANADCSADAKKIAYCYDITFFAPNLTMSHDAQSFHADFLKNILPDYEKNFADMCQKKTAFDKCVTNTTINACFNTQDFKNVQFTNGKESDARTFVATYLQMDYVCGRAYNMIANLYHCANMMQSNCSAETVRYATCTTADDYTTCTMPLATKQCGIASACLYKKFLALETCNQPDLNCDSCSSITAANKT
uniref:Uncharacterized protein n=1 Tax=Panagrolaimus sp. PS1159 TaxID=55785 RepID=A0AC35EZW1_9BILA